MSIAGENNEHFVNDAFSKTNEIFLHAPYPAFQKHTLSLIACTALLYVVALFVGQTRGSSAFGESILLFAGKSLVASTYDRAVDMTNKARYLSRCSI